MPNLIPIIALIVATLSLLVACISLYAAYRSFESAPAKVVHELLTGMSNLEDEVVALGGKYKKMAARFAGLHSNGRNQYSDNGEASESTADAMQPGETPAQWKARMRLKIHRGEIKHS